jgi:hypothetical protein
MMIEVIEARARHQALRAEVERDHLAAQAEAAGSGGLRTRSRVRSVALAGLVVGGLLLGGATVLAKDVTCSGGPCNGTAQADNITGSAKKDDIRGRDGNDFILGDPFVQDASPKADDTIRGGRGRDELAGNSSFLQIPDGSDTDVIFGGRGNDAVFVLDEDSADRVDCGPGEKDQVFFDKGDTVENCEVKNPDV